MSAHQERINEGGNFQACPITNCDHPNLCAVKNVVIRSDKNYPHADTDENVSLGGCLCEPEIRAIINEVKTRQKLLNNAIRTTQERLNSTKSFDTATPTTDCTPAFSTNTPVKFNQRTPNLGIKK